MFKLAGPSSVSTRVMGDRLGACTFTTPAGYSPCLACCPASAGPSGVSTNDIGDRLGLNMKRNEPRMKEVETRFGIKRSAINKVGGWRRGLASSTARSTSWGGDVGVWHAYMPSAACCGSKLGGWHVCCACLPALSSVRQHAWVLHKWCAQCCLPASPFCSRQSPSRNAVTYSV